MMKHLKENQVFPSLLSIISLITWAAFKQFFDSRRSYSLEHANGAAI